MMDMMTDDPKAELILDKVTEISILRAESFARAGVDIIFIGDDIGMQETILMSKALYINYIKPRHKKIIAAAKAINPEIIIFYHSCGFITPFIPDLIEIGVDVLNPVQPECMNFKNIHEMYGEQISFHGTIGTQTTMPFGTPLDVRKAVFKNLEIAGKKGGLFVAPTHLLEPEVPWENIIAYVEACKAFSTNKDF
jgi:uroporphyrinogen decarboxylase